MKKIIHVNRNRIDANRRQKKNDPVITVKTYKSNSYGHEVQILGPSILVHRPDTPLSCGAKVWLETEAEVIVDGEPVV